MKRPQCCPGGVVLGALLVLSLVHVHAVDLVVSNVSAAQRPGTQLVDITYDLVGPDTRALQINVMVSADGGATYDIPAGSFSGTGYGWAVLPGKDKRIVWDAGKDWPDKYTAAMRFRVTASTQDLPGNIIIDTPNELVLKGAWSAASLGIPSPLGGMLVASDGKTLYLVGAAESPNSALYSLPILRDPANHRILGFGPTNQNHLLFLGGSETPGLTAGIEQGPANTWFYTYYRSNFLGERTDGGSGNETKFSMASLNVPTSISGLTTSPFIVDPGTGGGFLQCSTFNYTNAIGSAIFNLHLTPTATKGVFEPISAQPWVQLPHSDVGGLQYCPAGVARGNLFYVRWVQGELWMLAVDSSTGLPYDAGTGQPRLGTSNPRLQLIAHGIGFQPWGLRWDPLTDDLLVTTFSGTPSDTVILLERVSVK